jgi:hypothetical protein
MSKPLWFLLIEQWKPKGMGTTGVTLSFLEGALAKIQSRPPSTQSIRQLLQEITAHPVSGYVTEVRWCANVDAPVLSVARLGESMPFKSQFSNSTGVVSLGFSQDVQSMFGLNCSGSDDCLEKLVAYASGPVEAGSCSRVRNSKTGQWEFGDFSSRESGYIAEVAALAGSQET